MLTQSISAPVANSKVATAGRPDQFHTITGHAGLVATEFSYKKDEEIYGEDEPSDYVYQVICGSVRSYKLLSDGRYVFRHYIQSRGVMSLGQCK